MVNPIVNFTPIFRYPSINGIRTGVLSLAIYLLLMFVLRFISKSMTKEFIIINIMVFILGLLLFWSVGAGFFVDTPNCA